MLQAKQRMERGVCVEVVETVRVEVVETVLEIQGGRFGQNLDSGRGDEAQLTGRTSVTEAISWSKPTQSCQWALSDRQPSRAHYAIVGVHILIPEIHAKDSNPAHALASTRAQQQQKSRTKLLTSGLDPRGVMPENP